ncbi:hypothetical protein [Streptococcus cuniculi]|uniref:hypothetical protein n=1 Tax=Streptococcus cuniculi TaxID=1432788 RepID=UPI00142F4556|nr:hypothetical protein [Streptococcus cuniculi]MBF0778347.1 hypothetical protein [Streptococcus cuniculi]
MEKPNNKAFFFHFKISKREKIAQKRAAFLVPNNTHPVKKLMGYLQTSEKAPKITSNGF